MSKERQKGFTLIEVIMASIILLIGLGVMGALVSRLVSKNFYGQRHTQAVILAQNKIEGLLNDGYSSDTMAQGNYSNPLNPVNATGDSSGVFNQYWTVQDVSPIQRSKQIISTVKWKSATGDTVTVILTAICIDQSN
jgi:prepilin-type N-terminal cleavage/methylation domain-containing protein